MEPSPLRRAVLLAVAAFAFICIFSEAKAAAPFVRLNLPWDGVVGGSPTNMPFLADAYAEGGVVTQVIFLVSGSVIATCTNSPWSATWTNTMPGTYQMQAAAVDGSGNWATSAVANVTLYTPPVYDITLDNLATNVVFSGQGKKRRQMGY
jgi:Big-like domain-containing protein